MKVFHIRKVLYLRGSIDSFHVTMFHGEALWWSREEPEPQKEIASIHNPIKEKLKVIRTGNKVPELFWPAHNFIVSDLIKNSIGGVDGVLFREVEFTRLVECDYNEGELLIDHDSDDDDDDDDDDLSGTWVEEFGESDPAELLNRLPDVKTFHAQIPTYWELLGAKSFALQKTHPGKEEIVFQNPRSLDWKVCLNKEAFEKYPIIYGHDVLIPDGPLAEILLPHCIPPYFQVEELNLEFA